MSDALIYQKLVAVMADVGAIGKGQENKFDKYKFRGIDDVYNAVQPALVTHGVVVVPQTIDCSMDTYETTKGATMQRAVVKVAHVFYAEDGSSLEATTMGEGADRGDKAINKAHSSAFKTALFQALCIPTEEKSDSENDSPEGQKSRTQAKKRAAKKAASQPVEDDGKLDAKGLVELKSAMQTRCEEIGAASDDWRVCSVDIARDLGFEKCGEMPQTSLPAALALVKDWTPKDTAPGFVDGEAA